jgi:SAM-dependent methyltransferase
MDDAGEFFDPFAAVYDARIEDGDGMPTEDVPFYRDLAREADGPALEVGVGTGRVYLELLADGLDVDGVDLSPGMLERCREKADARGLDAAVWEADVTEFDPDREYGLVYAPARAFNHLPTLPDQRAALERIRAALAPGGRFALNTFVPGFDVVAEDYGEEQVEHVTVDGTEYRYVSVATLDDAVEQVSSYRKELYAAATGELVAERETPLALVPKRQFELLFETAGFSAWTVHGGFGGDPLTGADQEMVWVVER